MLRICAPHRTTRKEKESEKTRGGELCQCDLHPPGPCGGLRCRHTTETIEGVEMNVKHCDHLATVRETKRNNDGDSDLGNCAGGCGEMVAITIISRV